jgi:hypothetical protein
MAPPSKVVVCLLVKGESDDHFKSCFWSILKHTTLDQVELRLAFGESAYNFNYALGTLCPDGVWPTRCLLPEEVERFGWTAKEGFRVWAWNSARSLTREQLARLLFHDVPLEGEYAICLDQGTCVEEGWLDALSPLMTQGIDCIGRPAWHEYLPGEAERIQAQPWYMGVPFERRDGRLGVAYFGGGLMAVRCERLRDVEYPGEVWFGEMGRQLGWSRAEPEVLTAENAENAERKIPERC